MDSQALAALNAAEQRFRSKIAPANAAGCWLWTAYTKSDGYGRVRAAGRTVYAHRRAWELASGAIPPGLCVLHHCDVRRCVNPAHLFLGTKADNNTDRNAKGRCVNPAHLFLGTKADNNTDRNAKGRSADRRGSKAGGAKLTEAEAVEVFHAAGSQRAIGDRFGLSQQAVCDIRLRKTWAHATGVQKSPVGGD